MPMSLAKKGLGRGLSSLIPLKHIITTQDSKQVVLKTLEFKSDGAVGVSHELTSTVLIREVSPLIIDVNPYQPRRDFKHDELEDLMNSIKEHGLLQPLVVTQKGDRYELIAGERRLRAVKILELSTVPVIVRKAEEHEKLEL